MRSKNRRQFLTHAATLPFGAGLWRAAAHISFLDSPPDSLHSYSQEFPDMLLSYLAKKTDSLAAEWDRVRSRIKTAA